MPTRLPIALSYDVPILNAPSNRNAKAELPSTQFSPFCSLHRSPFLTFSLLFSTSLLSSANLTGFGR